LPDYRTHILYQYVRRIPAPSDHPSVPPSIIHTTSTSHPEPVGMNVAFYTFFCAQRHIHDNPGYGQPPIMLPAVHPPCTALTLAPSAPGSAPWFCVGSRVSRRFRLG